VYDRGRLFAVDTTLSYSSSSGMIIEDIMNHDLLLTTGPKFGMLLLTLTTKRPYYLELVT